MEKAGFVIDGGRLIDGTGRAPSENASLLIRNGEIVEVSAGRLIGSDAEEVIDAHGKTIMPGLIDAHVHFCLGPLDPYRRALEPSGVKLLRGVQSAKRMIEAGFTTARDVGGLETIYLKRGIQEGLIPGPRILAARLVITQTAGHADIHFLPVEWNLAMNDLGRLADGPNECRKAVREQMREGADLIKICSTGGTWSERDLPQHRQFTMDELHAIVDEAHAWDRRVASHSIGLEGTVNALNAGVDTIEHGGYLNREIFELMVQKNVIYVPTCAISVMDLKRGPSMGLPEWALRKERAFFDEFVGGLSVAHRVGVKIALGTDTAERVFPIGENAMELEMLMKYAEMSAMEAIVAGTRTAAEALGLEKQLGTIEAGKLADVLVIDGDPLNDITILQDKEKIQLVMKEGNIESRHGV